MTTRKTGKDYDCVAAKRRAARAIYQSLLGKSHDERLDYWRDRTDALRQRQVSGSPSDH